MCVCTRIKIFFLLLYQIMKRKNITKEDLLTIAKTNSVKKGEKIIDEIEKIVKNWSYYANKTKVDKQLSEKIKNVLNTSF